LLGCLCGRRIGIMSEPYPGEWLLMEWPKCKSEPSKYWLSTLPALTAVWELARIAKHRWIIEGDDEELKQEPGPKLRSITAQRA
jgi:SRSO17 transposase